MHRLFAALAALIVMGPAARADSEAAQRSTGDVVSLDVFAHGDVVDLLTAEKNAQGMRLYHSRSTDGGRAWGPTTRVPAASELANPHRGADVLVAARGDLVVALFETKGTSKWGGGPLGSAVSSDAGRTWTPGPNPADDGSTDGHGYIDVSVDRAGAFHAVWLDARDGAQGLRASRSTDGRRWERNETIDPRTCECCSNTLATGAGGALLVLYRDKDPRDMALARTVRAGAGWARTGTVGVFDWAFEGCPHVGGGLAAGGTDDRETLHATVWTGQERRAGAYWLSSDDAGRTWPRQRLLDAQGRNTDVAARGAEAVVAWDGGSAEQAGVRVARSADAGATWSEQPLGTRGRPASHPRVLALGSGFLVVWSEASGHNGATVWKAERLTPPAARSQ